MGYVMEFTSIFHEAVITEDKSDIRRKVEDDIADQRHRSQDGEKKVRGSKENTRAERAEDSDKNDARSYHIANNLNRNYSISHKENRNRRIDRNRKKAAGYNGNPKAKNESGLLDFELI